MKLKALAVLLAILFFVPVLADEFLDKAKQTYDFDNWSGKDGKLKQGLNLKAVDLSPFTVASERNRLFTSGQFVFRYATTEGAAKQVFEVSLRVLDSVAEAQEELIGFLSTCTGKLPKGDSMGLEVGDVCFAAKDGDCYRRIVFVRNNIFLSLSLMPAAKSAEAQIPPDISEIAGKIDAQIKLAEEAEKTEELKKPVISEFTAASSVTKPDTPVEVTLEVSSPGGGKVDLFFDQAGAMVYEHEGKRYFRAEKPGTYTITVCAVNEHFLVSRKSLVIEVE